MKRKLFLSWAVAFMVLPGLYVSARAQSQNSSAPTATNTTTEATSMSKPSHTVTGKDLAITGARSASHTTLFRAMRVSGLTEQASEKGPYTVFAPTNEAFDKLPAGTMDELMKPAAKAKLVKLLAYHVVKGKYTADQLQDGQKLKTVTGGTLTVGKQGDTLTITDGAGNTATVDPGDAEATNGFVYSIDSVLMPTAGAK
ncbi:fasciclin domain-containing protein [Spirosoma sp. HMF3257]|uniref:Fasciclin domain-containing protein n=1 Tax=Spirosoma telluris TaxID=2183553 RepID=A0A327NL71_9BACT|nr:fasciclin domain-containing protein [Spirosoma telluris]RAI74674.1 fasciclin domain-containing protein [Spirosoma telluris]